MSVRDKAPHAARPHIFNNDLILLPVAIETIGFTERCFTWFRFNGLIVVINETFCETADKCIVFYEKRIQLISAVPEVTHQVNRQAMTGNSVPGGEQHQHAKGGIQSSS